MVFISAGHGWKGDNRDPGVVYSDYVEHILAFRVAYSCYINLFDKVSCVFVNTHTLQSKVKFINSIAKPDDIAIEFHFNSLPIKKDLSFSEILVYSRKGKDYEINQFLECIDFCRKYGILPKGNLPDKVSERKDLYFLKETKCKAFIIEVDFIWNAENVLCEDFGKAFAFSIAGIPYEKMC